MTYTVLSGTLNSTIPYHTIPYQKTKAVTVLVIILKGGGGLRPTGRVPDPVPHAL